MAHEFGHFAAERLQNNYNERPGVALVSGDWLNAEVADACGVELPAARKFFANPQGHEYFADVFAAFSIGPAYAAALAWRAVPHKAWQARDGHPGWGYRVHAVLRALGPEWDWMVDLISTAWQSDLEETASAGGAAEERLALVDVFVDQALAVLGATMPGAVYADRGAVLAAEQSLREGVRGEADIRAVVNAAWAHRLRRGWSSDLTAVG